MGIESQADSIRGDRPFVSARAATLGLVLLGSVAVATPAHAQQASQVALHQNAAPTVTVTIDDKIKAARVFATVDIAAPPEKVWVIMTNCFYAKRVVPGLASCLVKSRDPAGRWDIREHKIDWAWFLPNIRTVIRTDYDAPKKLHYNMVEGDLRLSRGEWRLEPLANGQATRVVHHSAVAADVPVPDFVIVNTMQKDMTTVMTNLRREALAADPR